VCERSGFVQADRTIARTSWRGADGGVRQHVARERRQCRGARAENRAVSDRPLQMASGRVRTGRRLHPSHGQLKGQFFVMKKLRVFSMARFRAMLAKEFIQMRRDRLTFAMMIGIPLLQLILFGYAINADPKHLPAAVLVAD